MAERLCPLKLKFFPNPVQYDRNPGQFDTERNLKLLPCRRNCPGLRTHWQGLTVLMNIRREGKLSRIMGALCRIRHNSCSYSVLVHIMLASSRLRTLPQRIFKLLFNAGISQIFLRQLGLFTATVRSFGFI